jgi:hypothetical protein
MNNVNSKVALVRSDNTKIEDSLNLACNIDRYIMRSIIKKLKPIDVFLVQRMLFATWPSKSSLLEGVWKMQNWKTENYLEYLHHRA